MAPRPEPSNGAGSTQATRIAALYDIHGNLPALEACIDEAATMGCDEFVFGGDVALGFMPSETVSRLMSMRPKAGFVMGNADREVIRLWDGAEPGQGVFGELGAWVAAQLDREQRDFLASFEPFVEGDVAGVGTVLFCHGTPGSDEEIITAETPEAILAEALAHADVGVVVGGHTHMQMNRAIAGKRFVNAGSVGMPYGGTGAYWLLLGPTVDLRHTAYDLEATAARIRATGAPHAADMASSNVLTAPSAAEAIDAFERQAGRRQ